MEQIKYPNGERVWVEYYSSNCLRYIMTSKENNRDVYFLYEFVEGQFRKLGKAKSPDILEEKFGLQDLAGSAGGTPND